MWLHIFAVKLFRDFHELQNHKNNSHKISLQQFTVEYLALQNYKIIINYKIIMNYNIREDHDHGNSELYIIMHSMLDTF